jgi:DNA-binding MarR family transcriptional regulator
MGNEVASYINGLMIARYNIILLLHGVLKQHKLTMLAWIILCILREQDEPIKFTDLTELQSLPPTAVSRHTNEMKWLGYLDKHKLGDGRTKSVELLPKGREILDKIDEEIGNMDDDLIKTIKYDLQNLIKLNKDL